MDGSVYMLELCEGLAVMQQNEKQSVNQMLERESKREKNLEARAKELKQKESKAREAAASDGAEKTPWEETVKAIEEEYWLLPQPVQYPSSPAPTLELCSGVAKESHARVVDEGNVGVLDGEALVSDCILGTFAVGPRPRLFGDHNI